MLFIVSCTTVYITRCRPVEDDINGLGFRLNIETVAVPFSRCRVSGYIFKGLLTKDVEPVFYCTCVILLAFSRDTQTRLKTTRPSSSVCLKHIRFFKSFGTEKRVEKAL